MNKKEMLENLINVYAGGNKAMFSRQLGVKPQTISSWLDRETLDVELIYAKCEGISAEWLLSGEGNMLKHSQYEDVNKELFNLCKTIVSNNQQRDKVMLQLTSMVRQIEK